MDNYLDTLQQLYYPRFALIFYEKNGDQRHILAESFEISPEGMLLNGHPLALDEAAEIAEQMQASDGMGDCLRPNGMLPASILYLDGTTAIWHTAPCRKHLFFAAQLGLENRSYPIPAMLWMATTQQLRVFALMDNERPHEDTPLYHAPFHNVFDNGEVCMGSVDVRACESENLQAFMACWQQYFFGSYFSHANRLTDKRDVITPVWRSLGKDARSFPTHLLEPSSFTFNDLL